MKRSVLVLSTLILAGGTRAQATIPDGYLKTQAVSWTNWPFGLSGPSRLQYLYDVHLIGRPVIVARKMAFRQFRNLSSGAKQGVELEISIGNTTKDPFNASTTFATNRGSNHTVVFKKKLVNLPARAASPAPPWGPEFAFDQPFVIQKSKGNLLIEYAVTKNTSGSYSHGVEWNLPPAISSIGVSCGGASQSVTGARPVTQSGNVTRFRVSGAPNPGVAVHVIGAALLPAPVALPFGGCLLRVNPLLFVPVTLSGGAGSVAYPTNVGLRTGPSFEFFGQFLTIDPTGPRWGTTPAARVKLGGFVNTARMYNTSSATSPTGRLQRGAGIIHRFRT